MFDPTLAPPLDGSFHPARLFELSRAYCIPICAVLVPANLLATLQTMLLAGFQRSPAQVQIMAIAACLYALVLLLHVVSWFAIGVVMAPTYILTALASLCILINLSAVLYRMRQIRQMQQSLNF